MTLSAEVFIHRFLLHLLPPGLQKIRFFGWMGRNVRKHNLQRIRQALGVTPPQRKPPEPRPVPVCPHRSNAALVLTGKIGTNQSRKTRQMVRGGIGTTSAGNLMRME
jgi:hypothetical protein